MSRLYIGIENELTSFRNGKARNAKSFFDELKSVPHHNISDTAIRTDTGNGYYIDVNEIELLTPPIAITKGFSSRLTDSLIIARDHVVASTPDYQHTGYSMHWNISSHNINVEKKDFYQGIIVPFFLFGLTPLSSGMNIRSKNDGSQRFELLGDHINNEDQINALALMLGSYAHALSDNTPLIKARVTHPENLNQQSSMITIPNMDGRYSTMGIYDVKNNSGIDIQAQAILETFYKWISPYVKQLGTKEEINNLESFIFMDKKLEMDNFKYFAEIKFNEKIKNGVYHPMITPDENNPGTILTVSNKNKDIPLEGRLLGEYVINKNIEMLNFTWDRVVFKEKYGNCLDIYGIHEIYRQANKINPTLPKHIHLRTLKVKDKDIDEFTFSSDKIKYDPEKDLFQSNENISLTSLMQTEVKTKRFFKNAIIAIGLGYLLTNLNSCIYEDFKIKQGVKSEISSYQKLQGEKSK